MNKEFFQNILPGTRLFSQFILLEIIYTGDLFGVFKCLAISGPQKGSVVSLKVTEAATCQEYRQDQLIREIKILGKMSHPNVVKSYDWFEDEVFLAFSMEFVDGGTLADLLRHPLIPINSAMSLLRQLALAMREIHRSGIIHRDIKPENILVTEDNILKLSDFGIAARAKSDKYFISNQISGTIDFISPEYIISGIYDHRSDIYSWGIVAYLMLTGHVPFEDESNIETLAKKATENPAPPCVHRKDLPQKISSLILKAISRLPEERFQSCEEILLALDEIVPAGEFADPIYTPQNYTELIAV